MMRKPKRFLLKILLTVMASTPTAKATTIAEVSSTAAKGPQKIEFWHSMTGQKGVLLKSIVEDFNRQSETQVVMQFIGSYEEGLNKLRTALLAGRGPNIVQITDVGTQVMIDSHAITPLQDFIDKDPDFPLALLLPQIRRYYEVQGKLYSLPFATSNPVLYYDADAFKKAGIEHPPATFAELFADALKLTDLKTKTSGVTWPLDSWFLEEFIARQGADFILPDNGRNGRNGRGREANYVSPEAIAFVSLWHQMVKNGSFANVGRGWDPAEQNFLAGRTKMLITSTSDIFEVLKQAPFRLGTAPIPTKDLGVKGGTIVGGNSLWLMKKKSASEEMASYRFLKFMASKETQEKWHTHTGYFPIRGDVIEKLKAQGFYEKYPVAWTAIEQLRNSPDLPATRGALMGVFPEAREHIMSAIEEVLSDRSSEEAALKKAKLQTDFSLTRYRRGGGSTEK
jgi:sn-glycerol 3-phosphate transport system substrate-binding protein